MSISIQTGSTTIDPLAEAGSLVAEIDRPIKTVGEPAGNGDEEDEADSDEEDEEGEDEGDDEDDEDDDFDDDFDDDYEEEDEDEDEEGPASDDE